MIIYGIPTCDTCKKAIKALEAAGHDITFRDVRAEPLSDSEWDRLLAKFGDRLVNTNSTTYRGLSNWMKASEAEAQLAAHPTLMKRPVIDSDGKLYMGWEKSTQTALLGGAQAGS
ncbi:arsenate reductase family protein [Profundibacterium mesophilum]|uniref:Arsenate reductase n=1 Tax=Profundibacterium mesophilum KAUST100406-0324 TaxID=1037889 RepID=A0A921NR46_9RHOB|nr:ArsC/Spx/MgsR family protein [Profundibacterium mesophilum]KAF0676987.1 Arsenate reductase [Profundibacterium mesophilum KAUST100406-0324]